MNRLHRRVGSLLHVVASVMFATVKVESPAHAWPTGICATSEPQYEPVIAPTGGGGAFVAYPAVVSGIGSVHGAVLTESGSLVPPVLCGQVLVSGFSIPRVCADGAGGFIIAVMRNSDIYAQRRDASGNLLWGTGTNGVPVCTASGNQVFADKTFGAVASDGSGGCYVTWRDLRGGGMLHDVYVQHLVGTDGSVATDWDPNGKQLSGFAGSGNETEPVVVPDGVGGAIVVWQDDPVPLGASMRVKASRVDANGDLHDGWAMNGNSVSGAGSNQATPTMISDGQEGAFVVWQNGSDVFATHLLDNATIDPNWPAAGLPLTQAGLEQSAPEIVSDGYGGGIVTWMDTRNSPNQDIYAQRFDGGGNVLWTADGVEIAVVSGAQAFPRLVSDNAGGAVICWDDGRNVGSGGDVFAQRIWQGGSVLWTPNGVQIAGGTGDQINPVIASDGYGGAVIAWRDYSVDVSGGDVVATRVLGSGTIGGVTGVWDGGDASVGLTPNPARDFVSMTFPGFGEESFEITVHDLGGRRIRRLAEGARARTRFSWNLRDDSGRRVAPGVYWVRASNGAQSLRHGLVVLE
jgi:hypothetical protein